jgi:hypothetical protein
MALSDKLNILFPIAVNEASIAVTPAPVTTLPAENVFNPRRDKFMRVIGTSAVIKFDALALGPATGFAFSHNLDDGSTVRVRLFSAAGQTGTTNRDSTSLTLDIDNSLDTLITQVFYFPFDTADFMSVQIDITAPTNTEIDIARIMIGYVFEPLKNFSEGLKWDWVDEGDERTAGTKYRLFNFTLRYLDNIENGIYENKKILVGKQSDLFICLQPSATGLELLKSSAFCKRFNDVSRVRMRANTNRHTDTFKEVV